MTKAQKIIGSIEAVVGIAVIGILGFLEFNSTTLHWIPNKEPYVNIALIRQTGSDPAKYTFIKLIASSTPNTGEYKVFPLRGLYEIECLPSPRACESVIATTS